MKILIVAMTDSVHSARWISQIANRGWEIHLFPSVFGGVLHPEIKGVTVHDSFFNYDKKLTIKKSSIAEILFAGPDYVISGLSIKRFHQRRLSKLIEKIKPDIVHTLEFQTSCYLMSDAIKDFVKRSFKWIATNWGSDIYYFGRFPEHERKIREVLSKCDYYSCECERDIALARQFGFKGETLPVFPNAGGFDLDKLEGLRQRDSRKRKTIMLKGYQGWSGRALIGLEALTKCKDLLDDYNIVMYSVDPSSTVPEAIKQFESQTGKKILVLPPKSSHAQILKHHGQSRVSIGLGISDAISTSLLEAMVMGSFPIQSNTACVDEWVNDGVTGIKVPPEDPDEIAKAIRIALTDDKLVESARIANYLLAKERLELKIVKDKVVSFYETVNKSSE